MRRSTILAPLYFIFQMFVVASFLVLFFLPWHICVSVYWGIGLSLQSISVHRFALLLCCSVALLRWKAFRELMEIPPSLL